MTVTDYCTVSCEECMKDAPYEYCCKLECGEHEFCRRCPKSDCCSLIIPMNGIDIGIKGLLAEKFFAVHSALEDATKKLLI